MNFRAAHAGLSYVEILVATTVFALILLPAFDALVVAMRGGDIHESEAVRYYRAYGRMEELMAEAYGVLETEALSVGDPNTPTSFSDAPGTADRRLVFLSLYDGDNADADDDPFTDTDAGLVWVRVQIEGTALAMESLKSQ